jgi:hypothetical protein
MPSGPLIKVTVKSASDICTRFELGEDARPLARPGQSPAQFLDLLMEKQQLQDAVKFLSHALPKRESVWWACSCVKLAAVSTADTKVAGAIRAAEKWVADPSEENRQAAMPAAEAAKFGTPAGCAALAAFFSGGSLGPPNVAAIPPAETLTGDAVAGAVMMSAVVAPPEKAPERYRSFLNRGIEIANGKSLWK